MATIEYSVAGQQIVVTKDEKLVENTIGIYTVGFTFDAASWGDFTQKTAVFVHEDYPDIPPYEVPIDNGEAPIPAAVLKYGNIMIGVYGSTQTQQYPTIWAPAKRVWPGAGPGVEPPEDPVFGMVVRTAPQELTEEQQEIARTNIGAAGSAAMSAALAGKVDKPVGATEGNVAVIGSNSNISDSGISKDNLILAPQLASNNFKTDSIPYKYRQTGGGIGVGNREYDSIVGGSVVWNQKLDNYNFASSTGWTARYGTVAVADNVITVTVSSTGTLRGLAALGNDLGFPYTAGQKLWLAIDVYLPIASPVAMSLGGASGKNAGTLPANQWVRQEVIWTSDTTVAKGTFAAYASSSLAQGAEIKYRNAFACNLTEMLGSTVADRLYAMEQASQGSAIAILKRMFPNSTYPYNATPSLESVSGLQSHKTVRFNLFDKSKITASNRMQPDGSIAYNSNSFVSDYIPVIPNTEYFVQHIIGTSSSNAGYAEYDDNKNLLAVYSAGGGGGVNVGGKEYSFTVTSGCRYIRFNGLMGYEDVTCLNISDPARNGTYEPYEEHTYPLDDSLTLRGVSAVDSAGNIYFDGDTYAPDGTVTRKYGIRAYQSGDESLANAITDMTNTVYKLTTPTTETAEPYESLQICDPLGTEEYVTTGIVPVGHVTRYPEDSVKKLSGLPSDFSTLIAPTEVTYKATRAYTTGRLLIVNNILYKATASIANGATLTVGTNITATTLDEVIASL